MTDFTVSSVTELYGALSNAQAGDVVYLKAGTYDAISLLGTNYDSSGVSIKSADVNNQAVITGLRLTQSSGLHFSNLVLKDLDATTDYTFQVRDSSDISFDKIKLIGPDGDAGYTSNPFMIRSSMNVSVTNSEFEHVRYGINMLDNDGIKISNNYFHDIRTDGVRGGGNSNIVVSSNYFTDFKPADGDHPDAIQFWTNGISTISQNITITDNVVVRGTGSPMQGIFMRDETNALPYTNVTISGNIVLGGMYNGIYVSNASGLIVTDNVVTGFPDQKSWIYLFDVTTMTGNSAQTFMLDGASTTVIGQNTLISAALDGGTSLLAAWQAVHGAIAAGTSGGGATPIVTPAPTDTSGESTEGTSTGTTGTSGGTTTVVTTPIVQNGTAQSDTLSGGNNADATLYGLGGDDWLSGGVGRTFMNGGAGNDNYTVRSVNDVVIEVSGGGDDTVSTYIDYTLTDFVETLRLKAEGLTVRGNALDNRMVGSDGADTIYGGAGVDTLMGLDGDDKLYGEDGNDRISGYAGNDVLEGGLGDDILFGGDGDDVLRGGTGKDILDGGTGNNLLSGGAGSDKFAFTSEALRFVNEITDFKASEKDVIDVSGIDANAVTGNDEKFSFLGTRGFNDRPGELRYDVVGKDIFLKGDTNGDGVADFTIKLDNVSSLNSSMLIL